MPELPPKIAARLKLGRGVAAEIPASSQENRAWIHVSPIIDPLKGTLEDRGPGVEPNLVSHGTENAVIGYSVRHREINRKYEEAPDDWDLIGLTVDEVYLVVTDDELTELLAKWLPDLNALGLPHDVGDPF
jgi:hypothetical protein